MAANMIVGIGLLLASIYIGRELGNAYRRRERFYLDIVNFCALLESEIGLFQNKLLDILERSIAHKDFNVVLLEVKLGLSERNQIDNVELVCRLESLKFLNSSEQEHLIEFLCGLGRLDVAEQIIWIRRHRQAYEQKLNECRSENKAKGGMCLKMGVIAGCLGFILVI